MEELYFLLDSHGGNNGKYCDYDEISRVETDLGPLWLAGMTHEYQFIDVQAKYPFDCVITITKLIPDLTEYGVKHIRYGIKDTEDPEDVANMREILSCFCDLIDNELSADRKILVHCAAGVSRSLLC